MRRTLLVLVSLLLSLSCTQQKPAHVVIVTIDGFPAAMIDDPKAPIPTLRELAKQGVVAQGMHVIDPAITWPNHTTLVTGVRADKHSVLFNGVLVRSGPDKPVKIDPARDQADLVQAPTLFDLLHRAGLRTSAINWPCTRNAPGLDDNFPDVPDQIAHMSPWLRRDLVAASVLTEPTDPAFKRLSSAAHDQVWTAAACRSIREHRPNLLLFHLLVVDGLHHNYGAGSSAGYAGLALADNSVREVLQSLEAAGIREQTTVFVVADHGFASADKQLFPNILLRKAGLLTAGPTTVVKAKAMAISEGGSALVYLTDRSNAVADRAKLVEIFKGQEGIDKIVEPAGFPAMGIPLPDSNAQAPDLILSAADGYAFSNTATGEDFVSPIVMGRHNVGYHGYLAAKPSMDALFIASGRGVRSGARVGFMQNVNVAPTAAWLLGQKMEGTDGKLIREILKDRPGD